MNTYDYIATDAIEDSGEVYGISALVTHYNPWDPSIVMVPLHIAIRVASILSKKMPIAKENTANAKYRYEYIINIIINWAQENHKTSKRFWSFK